jgi:hypothetical protein
MPFPLYDPHNLVGLVFRLYSFKAKPFQLAHILIRFLGALSEKFKPFSPVGFQLYRHTWSPRCAIIRQKCGDAQKEGENIGG